MEFMLNKQSSSPLPDTLAHLCAASSPSPHIEPQQLWGSITAGPEPLIAAAGEAQRLPPHPLHLRGRGGGGFGESNKMTLRVLK